MLGFSPSGCTRNRAGTYTCVLRNDTEVRRVVYAGQVPFLFRGSR